MNLYIYEFTQGSLNLRGFGGVTKNTSELVSAIFGDVDGVKNFTFNKTNPISALPAVINITDNKIVSLKELEKFDLNVLKYFAERDIERLNETKRQLSKNMSELDKQIASMKETVAVYESECKGSLIIGGVYTSSTDDADEILFTVVRRIDDSYFGVIVASSDGSAYSIGKGISIKIGSEMYVKAVRVNIKRVG